MEKGATGLAGEFFVLAQLHLQGLVGTLTLGHTKGVDILVSNPNTGKLFQLEVKTTTNKLTHSNQFGDTIEWRMTEKHETIGSENLYYCFVQLLNEKEMPNFYIVPSKKVAEYITDEYKYWNNIPRKKAVKLTTMRTFRICFDKRSKALSAAEYGNKWDYFK